MWTILIGFPNTNDFVNVGICTCEFKFTYQDIADLPQADV